MSTDDGYPIEVTDTFLPAYTKNCINEKTNALKNYEVGSRRDRWMIGVSVMSGCPVKCKFCATAKLKKWRCLTADEIIDQVLFILWKNPDFNPRDCFEFKINFTRMGEPFLNIDNVKEAIEVIQIMYPNVHCYVSTIGVEGSDYNWINENVTLQFSIHALNEEKRNWLIPYKHKMTINEIGRVRTQSKLKTTLNLSLVDEADFNIEALKQSFDPDKFFIKISPINKNSMSEKYGFGEGVIEQINLI